MAPAGGDGASARGGGLEEEEPEGEEEDYEEAVTRHAKYLGIDPELDAAYIWIAEEVGPQQYSSYVLHTVHVQTTAVRVVVDTGHAMIHTRRRRAQPNRLAPPTTAD